MSEKGKRIRDLWAEYEPQIKRARKRESEKSSLAFVDLHEEHILDLPAVILTIERYLLLEQSGVFDGSCGDEVNPVLLFLWIVSPEFVAEPRKGKAFFRKHRKLDFPAYTAGIDDYVERMFHGSRTVGGKGSDSGGGNDWVASIIDLVASEYSWTESAILRSPIPRLLKYADRIRIRHGGDAIQFASEADRLQAEFMDRANVKGAN